MQLLLSCIMSEREAAFRAKRLLQEFRSAAEAISADANMLADIAESDCVALLFPVIHETAIRLARAQIEQKPILKELDKVVEYCRAAIGYSEIECFLVLYLNAAGVLITDEVQFGTVDRIEVYPREIVRLALNVGATELILAHNHPSGDPSPSAQDLTMTAEIMEALERLDIRLRDHIVASRQSYVSFREHGLL